MKPSMRWRLDRVIGLMSGATTFTVQGTHLTLYPFLLTSWYEWRRLHADTLVLKPLPGYAERIAATNVQIRQGYAPDAAVPAGCRRTLALDGPRERCALGRED